MFQHGFHQLIPDGNKRVQRGQRVLKHHPDLLAAHTPHGVPVKVIDARALKVDLTAGNARGPVQKPNDGVPGHRLARSRFADHAQDLSGGDIKRHPIHRLQKRGAGGDFHHKISQSQDRCFRQGLFPKVPLGL